MAFVVVASMKTLEGKGADFEAAFAGLTPIVRATEPGVLYYQLTKSRTEANLYKVVEAYADKAAFDLHCASEAFLTAWPGIVACLDGPPTAEMLDAV